MPVITAPQREQVLLRRRVPPLGTSPTSERLSKSSSDAAARFYRSSESLRSYELPLLENIPKYRADYWTTVTETRKLLERVAGWNGYEATPPRQANIEHAYTWIRGLFLQVLDMGYIWLKPNVTAGVDGEVVYEWWNRTKKLTIYIEDDSVMYVRSWGDNIDEEMDDGNAESINVVRLLWKWLVNS